MEIELLKHGYVASQFDCTIYVSPCGDVCASGAGFQSLMQSPYNRFSLREGGAETVNLWYFETVKRA